MIQSHFNGVTSPASQNREITRKSNKI